MLKKSYHRLILREGGGSGKEGGSANRYLRQGSETFINHYYVHASDTPVGQIILNEFPPEG